MSKLLYDEFVTIYDHHNIFWKYGHWCFFVCLFKCSLFNIFLSMVHEYAYISWIYEYISKLVYCFEISLHNHRKLHVALLLVSDLWATFFLLFWHAVL